MLRTLQTALVAAAATLMASTAIAQVNLVSHAAGAGTAGGLAATGLVEFASEAGVANIQLKTAKPVQNSCSPWLKAKSTLLVRRTTCRS